MRYFDVLTNVINSNEAGLVVKRLPTTIDSIDSDEIGVLE